MYFHSIFYQHLVFENEQCTTQKKPRLSSRDNASFLFPQSLSSGFSLLASTHNLTNSFICNFLSSSAGFNLCSCFFRLTLVFRFRFQLSLGRTFHFLSSASCPLSDLRCFGFLSSTSVLDSDYSASVSSFPSLPGSA